MTTRNFRCWPVSSDIGAQENVGVRGNSGRAEESQNPPFLTHSEHTPMGILYPVIH